MQKNERKIYQKKYGIDDGAKCTTDMNTLLEPNNNNSASQNDAEEIREVSIQLNGIKKKHDEAKKLVNAKKEEFDRTRKDIDQLSQQEQQLEGPIYQIQSRLEQLKDALDGTQARIDEETMTKSSYTHMLDRMERDYIASRLKANELEISIKSKSQILDLESHKHRKTKEDRLQSKAIFDSLMLNIEKEQKDRQERIIELQKCIKNKEESVQRRIERQRRNAEIAEAAANENKDSSELILRQQLYINKLWNTFMRKKMEKEMKRSQNIDDAFKAIKTATQVTDVQELVRKFLSREQTYSQLLTSVSQAENKIDSLKAQNETLCARLSELTLDSNADKDKEDKKKAISESDSEILLLRQEADNVKRNQQRLSEKFKGINIVNDQISTWAKRCYQKFGLLTDDPIFQQDPEDLVKVFAAMENVCTKELEDISKRREEGEEEEGIEYGEVFNDFATEDFINKNIRVRPISGVTHQGGQDNDGRQSNVSRGLGDAGGDDQEDNFNRMAILELEGQRKERKDILRKKLEDARRKAEQEEARKKRKAAE